jgi:hypothetical protein
MIRKRDLFVRLGNVPQPVLVCRICGKEYSANPADYFLLKPDYVFGCCDREMQLVDRRTVYVTINIPMTWSTK